LERGPGYYGLGAVGLRRGSLASRHAGSWLGNSVELHLVGASKNKGIPDMRIENGKTTKISIHIPSLLAAEAFTVDNHEEEEEEQVEH
jgi:hypothetical protein